MYRYFDGLIPPLEGGALIMSFALSAICIVLQNILIVYCLFGPLIITTAISKKGPAITKVPHSAWAHALSL